MDYENYAGPALKLARARVASMGGCMGCPTCGKGSGMFMGGADGDWTAEDEANFQSRERKMKELKKQIAAAEKRAIAEFKRTGQPIPEDLIRPVRQRAIGPRRPRKPSAAQIAAAARRAARAERNACVTNCRSTYLSALPPRGPQKPRTAAQQAATARLVELNKARKKGSGLMRGRRRRVRMTRGRGLEMGDGLDYGSGMQYY